MAIGFGDAERGLQREGERVHAGVGEAGQALAARSEDLRFP